MTRFGSVICISPDTEIGGRIIKHQLTYGKAYDILTPGQKVGGKFYVIKNDGGVTEEYLQSKFVTLEGWREKQIDSIL